MRALLSLRHVDRPMPASSRSALRSAAVSQAPAAVAILGASPVAAKPAGSTQRYGQHGEAVRWEGIGRTRRVGLPGAARHAHHVRLVEVVAGVQAWTVNL